MLTVKLYPDSNIVLNDDLKSDLEEIQKLQVSDDITLHIADKVFLSWDSDPKLKPLCFDFLSDKLIYRISHGGKHKENVARAVTSGLSHPVVFDATAGMGRDSFILQCAGCSVYMFERNPVIWLLLRDALTRASSSPFFKDLPNGLPSLMPCGEACRYQGDVVPDVIYYDPMFPDRKKSALVKKEMRIFKALLFRPDLIFKLMGYVGADLIEAVRSFDALAVTHHHAGQLFAGAAHKGGLLPGLARIDVAIGL